MRQAETREHVIDVAQTLFYRDGVRATGVDRLAAESGLAPTTLYRAFPSKDAIVEAYVSRGDELGRLQFVAAEEAAGPVARDQILAVFDSLAEWLSSDGVRGCPWQIVLAEFPDPASPARMRAAAAKTWLLDAFDRLAARHYADLGIDTSPDRLARQLFVIYEGHYATTLSHDPSAMTGAARALVELALDNLQPSLEARRQAL